MKGESIGGRVRLGVLATLVVFGGAVAWLGQGQQTLAQGRAARHRMTKITETIYRADAPGTPGINATSWVFVNDSDVLVTDSEGSPASARSLLEGVKSITDKPVRYLVDTHFHIDHAYGNAALPPTVQIIGHEFSRKMLLGPEARQGVTFRNFTDPMPGRIENLRKQVAAEADATKKATLQQQLTSAEATLAVYSGDFPLQAPNVTISNAMSVWSGNKEFRIMWAGRAHTAGDLDRLRAVRARGSDGRHPVQGDGRMAGRRVSQRSSGHAGRAEEARHRSRPARARRPHSGPRGHRHSHLEHAGLPSRGVAAGVRREAAGCVAR